MVLSSSTLKHNEAQSARAESTHKGVNQRWTDVTQTQQQRPESPTVTFTLYASKYKVHKFHQRCIRGESYRRRLGSLLLFLCDVCRALINSLVCCFCRCVSPLVFVVVDECCSRVRSACLSAPIESFQTTHQPQVTYCPPHPYLPSVPVSFSLDVEPVCLSSLSDWTINASFSPP